MITFNQINQFLLGEASLQETLNRLISGLTEAYTIQRFLNICCTKTQVKDRRFQSWEDPSVIVELVLFCMQ